MKVLIINSVCGIRSTGRIAVSQASAFAAAGDTVRIAYGREAVPEAALPYAVRIGSDASVRRNAMACRALDNDGFGAKAATRKFLAWAEEYGPDLLWLHNLHGYYLNAEMLFAWIKGRPGMEVRWTLHDCWAFTGHCSYFTFAGCGKWKTACGNCPQKREYPASLLLDRSRRNFERKRAAFTGVPNMKLVTPSRWLKDLVGQSFLREYSVEVVHNTVDGEVFRPTPGDVRQRLGIEERKMILGVAAQWQPSKGYGDFFNLADRIPPDTVIVLAGVTEKQKAELKPNMIGIGRTNSARELAELYTAADVFFNPTYEDNYPTVNLEAAGCGTPVITYGAGGSGESVPEDRVFAPGDLDGALAKMLEILGSC